MRFTIILKKNHRTLEKSIRGPTSSLRNFREKALNFSQNQPVVQQFRFKEICKENFKFSLNQPDVQDLFQDFFRKTLGFQYIVKQQPVPFVTSTRAILYYNLNTKMRWNQKLLNIEFDQEFKTYNFVIK